jgi:hypothetical protein
MREAEPASETGTATATSMPCNDQVAWFDVTWFDFDLVWPGTLDVEPLNILNIFLVPTTMQGAAMAPPSQ